MPIAFDCACGRHFSVNDEYAGKRTKCPSCGGPLIVPAPEASPAPEPEPTVSAEDAAYRALMDGPDPEPAQTRPAPRATEDERPRTGPSQIKATAAAPKPRPNPVSDGFPTGYEPEPRRPAFHISSGVLGGFGMMAGAVIWFVVGLAAGVLFFYPPILFLFGLVTFVRALFGHED